MKIVCWCPDLVLLGSYYNCPPAPLTGPSCFSPLQLARGVNSGQGLGIEIIGTLQLVLCVLATTDRRRRDLGGSAPLAIGFSVALGHLLAVSRGIPGWEPWWGSGSKQLVRRASVVSVVLWMELPPWVGDGRPALGARKRTQGPLIMPLSPLGLIVPFSALSLSPWSPCPFLYILALYMLPSRSTTLAAASTLPDHLALL